MVGRAVPVPMLAYEMPTSSALRQQLARALDWPDAHGDFAATVADLEPALRGVRPPGLPHSAWELLEHLRLAVHDILDFCRNPDYHQPEWPDDYWPASTVPATGAWDAAVTGFRQDITALQQLATDPAVDLMATIPHGSGQTYLRELLVVLDHDAYHLGQLVLVRRALGAWPA